MRRRKRKKKAVLTGQLQLPIQRVDFGRRRHDVHLSKAFQHRTVGLEHEVIAVFRTPQTLADGAVIDVRVKNEIHGIPR